MSQSFHCAICGGESVANQFRVTREDKYARHNSNASHQGAEYRECKTCGAMSFNGTADFEQSYSDGFYYSVDGDPAEFLAKRFATVVNLPAERSDNLQRVKRIRDFLSQHKFSNKPPHRVLDIGAGMGVFLHAFLDAFLDSSLGPTWSGVAVEPDEHCVKHMQKVNPQVKSLRGYSSEIHHEGRYQLITLNRVLEHIADPLPVLRSERDHLDDDGIVYIELPDVWSFFYDGPNNEAFGFGHYIVYSPAALELLAAKAGFEVLHLNRVIEPSTKFTLYAFFRKTGSGPRPLDAARCDR